MIKVRYFSSGDKEMNFRVLPTEVTYREGLEIINFKGKRKAEYIQLLSKYTDNPAPLRRLTLKTGDFNLMLLFLTVKGAVLEYVPPMMPNKLHWIVGEEKYTLTPERALLVVKTSEKDVFKDFLVSQNFQDMTLDKFLDLNTAQKLFEPQGMPDPSDYITWADYITLQYFILKAIAVDRLTEQVVKKEGWRKRIVRWYLKNVSWQLPRQSSI